MDDELLEEIRILVITEISEGNLGCIDAIHQVAVNYLKNDPISQFAFYTLLLLLDVRGSQLYLVWNDECGRNPELFYKKVISSVMAT